MTFHTHGNVSVGSVPRTDRSGIGPYDSQRSGQASIFLVTVPFCLFILIIMTGFPSMDTVIEAMHYGASEIFWSNLSVSKTSIVDKYTMFDVHLSEGR